MPWLKGTVYDIFTSVFSLIISPIVLVVFSKFFTGGVDTVTTMLPVTLDTVDILVDDGACVQISTIGFLYS